MVSLRSVLLLAGALTTTAATHMAQAAFTACASAPATPEDRRTDTSKLKYTTYNTEFMFLANYGGLDCPGADCKWKNVSMATTHIQQVASIIKALDSDILQLNEVEDCVVLDTLILYVAELGDATYKPYLIRGTDTATGQNAALLTRIDPIVALQRSSVSAAIPVSNSTCPASSGYASKKSVSKHFYTSFNVSGFSKPITVIGAHLLAQPDNKPRCFEREAQATVLAGIAANATAAGYHAILSGDINDWSATYPDKNGNLPISNVLGILTGENMVQTEAKAEVADRFTEWYDEDDNCVYEPTEVSSLDHILVSKSLEPGLVSAEFGNTLYDGSCTSYNSDHWPISITLSPV